MINSRDVKMILRNFVAVPTTPMDRDTSPHPGLLTLVNRSIEQFSIGQQMETDCRLVDLWKETWERMEMHV